ERRVPRGDPIEVPRMTVVDDDAAAAGQSRAEPCRADEDERRDPRFDAKIVERLPRGIARRSAPRPRHREANETGRAVDAATQLAHAVGSGVRIDVNPVAEDDVRVVPL